jgi:hypothetical protein
MGGNEAEIDLMCLAKKNETIDDTHSVSNDNNDEQSEKCGQNDGKHSNA